MKITVVGGTGLSGKCLVELLETSDYPISLQIIASEKSVGRSLLFRNEKIFVQPLTTLSLQQSDYIFFAAGSNISKKYIPLALESSATIIDLSSAFRKNRNALLIIPEINGQLIKNFSRFICSPNCTTTLLLTTLFPLHKLYQLESIITSSYQAASGGGYQLLKNLLEETQSSLKEAQPHHKYAFNIYPHPETSDTPFLNCEEDKMIFESRKILNNPSLEIFPTCIRVPSLRSHSLSIHATFKHEVSLKESLKALSQCPILRFQENLDSKFCDNKPFIYYSRLRKVKPKTLELWVCGDQLLKGAALNAFQIFEQCLKVQKASKCGNQS